MLVVAAAVAPFRDRWLVQMLLVGWLLFAPGRLLLTALRIKPIQVSRFPVYTVAMSVLLIMLTGLAVDGIGVLLGDHHPLRTVPLWVGTVVTYLVVLAAATAAPNEVRPHTQRPGSIWPYWVFVLPLLAAAGAARLNSDHGSTVALIAMIALVATFVVRPFLPRFSWRVASISIYAVSLAGCWSFSLRGDSVYGYDIVTEYLIAQNTDHTGIWHLHHPNDAYGALLSVSILPTALHGVAGLAVLAFFKALVPALLAFVPVGVMRIAGRLLGTRWAYAATGVFVGQVFFMAGIPAVTRQAIAFVFLVALVAGLLERRQPSGTVLACVAAAGVVLSHYSSSYMAVAVLGVATVLLWAGRLLRRRPPARFAIVIVLLVLAAGSAAWYDGLTHSASNASSVADTFDHSGLDLLPNRAGGVLSTIIKGNVGQPMAAGEYQKAIAVQYRELYPFVATYRNADKFPLQSAVPTPSGGIVSALGAPLVSVIGQLVNIFGFVGSLILAFGRRWKRRTHRVIGVLGLGSATFLLLIRVSGTAAQVYNLERAQLQGLIVLAPIAMWTVERASCAAQRRMTRSRRHSRERGILPVLAGGLAVIGSAVLVVNSVGLMSVRPASQQRANLSASGLEVARFVMQRQDVEGGRWLIGANPDLRQATYADNYGRFRILLAAGAYQNVFGDITPETLSQRSWVFEYSANSGAGEIAQGSYEGRPAVYRFPQKFLDEDFDKVYTNGKAQVFFG